MVNATYPKLKNDVIRELDAYWDTKETLITILLSRLTMNEFFYYAVLYY